MNSEKKIIDVKNKKEWIDCLELFGTYDVYHLPEFHLLSMSGNSNRALLFYLEQNGNRAAIPFILKPIDGFRGFKEKKWFDAISVYGYPGLLTNSNGNSKKFLKYFFNTLKKTLGEMNVVSFFSRLNPIINASLNIENIIKEHSKTVVIDLFKSEKEILKSFSKGHRYDIRRSRRNGVIVEKDNEFKYYREFIDLYYETMNRIKANEYYYFSEDYFDQLKKNFKNSLELYVAKFNGKIISASLFFVTKSISQYHLSGTLSDFVEFGGSKLILNEAIFLSKTKKVKWFHLGGGFGSKEDSLFRFKAGFSKERMTFRTINLKINNSKYNSLLEDLYNWEKRNDILNQNDNYFPLYRRPIR